jgi:Xaa-Pro aminopeptidase
MPTGSRSADFPPIEYAGRVDRIRAQLDASEVGGLVVTDLTNVRWLTGFTGSNGSVAVLPDRLVLVTDGRYRDRANDELAAAGVEAELAIGFNQRDQLDVLVASCAGLDAVGAEAGTITYARWRSLSAELTLRDVSGVIENERRMKDRGEIARIHEGCRCADAALADVAPVLLDEPTEADVRRELEYRMRCHGADGASYDTIVASGPEHAARPHHDAGDRTIVEGDTVVIDVGALVDGYHSDMTRSYVIGEPTSEQALLYDLLLAIQGVGLDTVRAGVAARSVDHACRSMAIEHGYGDWFLHSTGHGVGLMIHEDPFESPTSRSELRAGDVVTVEPGLYRVGFGGFRIEDLVEVTDTGCRILTASPKDTPCPPSPPTI